MSVAKGIRAGRAFVELATDDTKLQAGLKAAQARLMAFGKGISAVGAGLFAAGAAASTAFAGAAKVFSDQGDAIAKMARRTGLSTEAVSELGYAADLAGTDAATLETGIRKMQIAITDAANGAKPAIETLDRLGLSASQLAGLTPDAQLEILADRLSAIADPAAKAALAQDLFGKSGTQLIPLLQDGSAGLRAMRKEAVSLGLSVGGKTAENAEMLNDAIGRLTKTLNAVVFNIGASVGPMLADLADKAAIVVAGVVDWIKKNPELVQTALQVSAAVAGIGAVLVVVGGAIVGIGAVIGGLVSIVSAAGAVLGFLGTVFAAITAPVWIAIGAVVAIGAALLYFTDIAGTAMDWVSGVFSDFAGIVKDTLGGVVDALMAGNIELAVQILWQGIKTLWEQGIATITNLWTNAINDLAGAFVVIETTVRDIFDSVTSYVGKKMGDLARALGVDELVLGVKLDDQAFADSQKAIDSDTEKRRKAREKEQTDRIAAIEASRKAEIDANEQKLRDSKAALKALTDQAAAERKAADERRGKPSKPRPGPGLPELPDAPAPPDPIAAAEQVMAQARVSLATTFSSSNLSGLGVGDENARKTAEATAETARVAKGIKDLIMQNGGGSAFA